MDQPAQKPKRNYTRNTTRDDGIKLTKEGRPRKPTTKNPHRAAQQQALRVVELAAIDTPRELIAQAVQLPVQQVDSIINDYKGVYKKLEELPKLRQVRGELIEATVYQMLESLVDPTCIAEADLKQRAYAFDRVFTADRLQSGKSTSNTAHLTFTAPAKRLKDIT